jgi:MraZ protein
MLRGNHTARIDSKGRLKVPTPFRRYVEDKHGSGLYITSLTGDCARIYPLPEWEAVEQRLLLLPSMDPTRRKFLDITNYYGQESSMDNQGRVVIHPKLRKSAGISGEVEVEVLGYLTYIEIWEHEKFQHHLLSNPFTAEDEATLARLGI